MSAADLQERVLIVGGGLAGLACAVTLRQRGRPVLLFEASDRVGGRVRSDVVEGFTLDRGFQIHLDAYPEGQRLFDADALGFRAFDPVARIREGSRWLTVADPRRAPLAALGSVLSGAFSLADLRAGRAMARATSERLPAAAEIDGTSASAWLAARGASPRLIERFLRPFFGGVFLDRSLETDSGRLRYYLGCFAAGRAVVPKTGMGALAESLRRRLPDEAVRLRAPVAAVEPNAVTLSDGTVERGGRVVVATDMSAAGALLGTPTPVLPWCSTTTIWFATPGPTPLGPRLHLNGTPFGPLNHVADLAAVAPEYAPPGRGLIAANIVGDAEDVRRGIADERELSGEALRQLADWFGRRVVRGWRALRIDRIERAVPRQHVEDLRIERPTSIGGVELAGDHLVDASINGALRSGRLAAERIASGEPPARPVPSAA